MLDRHLLARAASSLDPIPVSVGRLLDVIARDHWAFDDVEEIIVRDQALTGRLLQSANSAASASLVRVGTVRDAVVRVGIGPVVSFAVASCLGPTFQRALPEYGLSEGDLWRHSVAASLAAEVVGALSPVMVPPEAVTAALLHDVGKLVLARFLTPELVDTLARARTEGGASEQSAEVAVLGVDHAELGGMIARHWRVPERVAHAIAFHHTPDTANDAVCDAVHVANVAAHLVAPPQSAAPGVLAPEPGALERLGLNDPQLERTCRHVSRRLQEVTARYATASRVAVSRSR